MKAKTLEEALGILDPEQPLSSPEDLRQYFVERPLSRREELLLLLQQPKATEKFLFSGHRGSGKSTELSELARELGESTEPFFFPVNYSVRRELNLYSLDYVDVLLSLGLQLVAKATQQNMQVRKDVLVNIQLFLKEISTEIQMSAVASGELGAEVYAYVVKLSKKMRTEDQTRLTVRSNVGRRISDLLENIDLLVREIEKNTKRRTVIIVEDIDKTDLATAKRLFYDYGKSLLAPNVIIIYTFPIALRHDNDFGQIRSNFPNVFVLPNLKVNEFDGLPDPNGRAALRDIVAKRVDERLFEADTLDALIALSGGLPRELLLLTRQAVLNALVAKRETVAPPMVEASASDRQNDYRIMLNTPQLNLLAEISKKRSIENDEAHRALLHNLSVLEYRNHRVWYDAHPIVKPLLPLQEEKTDD